MKPCSLPEKQKGKNKLSQNIFFSHQHSCKIFASDSKVCFNCELSSCCIVICSKVPHFCWSCPSRPAAFWISLPRLYCVLLNFDPRFFQYPAMWITFSILSESWSPGTYDVLLTRPSRHLLAQSQLWKHQYSAWNLFKINNRNLNLFFYCELWPDFSHYSGAFIVDLERCWL